MERGVTYAMFGKSNRGDADVEYIGSYDLMPTERDVERWLEDYPVVSVSRDVLGEDGVWVSVETEFYRVDEGRREGGEWLS